MVSNAVQEPWANSIWITVGPSFQYGVTGADPDPRTNVTNLVNAARRSESAEGNSLRPFTERRFDKKKADAESDNGDTLEMLTRRYPIRTLWLHTGRAVTV